jgi:hypothetical protein
VASSFFCIDEATGHQEVRDRLALQEILDKYLRKEFAKWAKRFPDEFYIEMFKLKGWEWRGMSVLIFSNEWTNRVRDQFALLRLVWVVKTAILEVVRKGEAHGNNHPGLRC